VWVGWSSEHLSDAGAVHGGVLATLLDAAMGAAVLSRTGENDVPATSQPTVTCLRPGKPSCAGERTAAW
jgi:acyl-coenzyme A thioesterase PaaI-like protein